MGTCYNQRFLELSNGKNYFRHSKFYDIWSFAPLYRWNSSGSCCDVALSDNANGDCEQTMRV